MKIGGRASRGVREDVASLALYPTEVATLLLQLIFIVSDFYKSLSNFLKKFSYIWLSSVQLSE